MSSKKSTPASKAAAAPAALITSFFKKSPASASTTPAPSAAASPAGATKRAPAPAPPPPPAATAAAAATATGVDGGAAAPDASTQGAAASSAAAASAAAVASASVAPAAGAPAGAAAAPASAAAPRGVGASPAVAAAAAAAAAASPSAPPSAAVGQKRPSPEAPAADDSDASGDDGPVAAKRSRLRKGGAPPPAPAPVAAAAAGASAAKASKPPASKGKKAASDEDEDEDDEDDDDSDADEDDEDEEEESVAPARARGAKPKAAAAGDKRKRSPGPAARAAPAKAAAAATAGPGAGADADGGAAAGVPGDGSGALSYGQHEHWSWKWWQAPDARDAQGRAPGHPLFDRRTLRVPPNVKFTPAKVQWWAFKAQHMDTLLFFRQGKFYETFNMDADALVAEGIAVYMKGKEAHAGLPERSYGAASEKLRRRGYRVARIEQVETPEQMRERTGKSTGVVQRELCGIKSAGVALGGHLDFETPSAGGGGDGAATGATAGDPVFAGLDAATGGAGAAFPTHLLSLREVAAGGGRVRIGAVVADCGTGELRVAEFVDDRARTRLRTLLQRYPPAEVIVEAAAPAAGPAATTGSAADAGAAAGVAARVPRRPGAKWAGLSEQTARFLAADAPAAREEALARGTEAWSARETAEELVLLPYVKPAAAVDAAAAEGASGATPLVASTPGAGRKLAEKGNSPGKLRLWDYFAPVPAIAAAPSRAATTAAAASAAAAAPAAAVATAAGCTLVTFPDGGVRTVPDALVELLARARAEGYAPPQVEAAAAAAPAGDDVGADDDAAADVPPASLALAAFGGLVWTLRRALVDYQVLSQRRVGFYKHADGVDGGAAPSAGGATASAAAAGAGALAPRGEGDGGVPHLVLDGATLANLDVLENSDSGARAGSLLGALDRTVTPFGRRRFRQWLTGPLLRPVDIEDRLRAVDDLLPLLGTVGQAALARMRKLPDLEKLVARVHSLGSKVVSADHPDARAVFYEHDLYNKRRINDLLQSLAAFDTASDVRAMFHTGGSVLPDIASPMLRRVIDGSFPDLAPLLAPIAASFDAAEAKKDATVTPKRGRDAAYDDACGAVDDAKGHLASYLSEVREQLKTPNLEFYSSAKDRYLIEVPDTVLARVPSKGFNLQSKKKGSGKTPGVWRYTTEESEALVARLAAAEAARDDLAKDSLRRLFESFDAHRAAWQAAISCLATLDCLLSLAAWSAAGDGRGMVRPELLPPPPPGGEPYLHLAGARHPTLAVLVADKGSFIPNDITLGHVGAGGAGAGGAPAPPGGPACVLISGPNMGGKSTYMRTAAACALLAQLGAYVPATACRLTPVDRIFTRVGASDRLLAGQSTFFVELAETSAILAHATRHSLVLLDELGRGTSTFDGAAIAYAVVKALTMEARCRTLFATHYHTLSDDFAADPRVALGHMSAHVEEGADGIARVTFLYTYKAGACPKSYGLHVATLAKLPQATVQRAKVKSEEFEAAVLAAERAAGAHDRVDPGELYRSAKRMRLAPDDAEATSTDDIDKLIEAAMALSGQA